MKFITIGQYFLKLYSAVLIVSMMPVFIFVVIYNFVSLTTAALEPSVEIYAIVSIILILDWWIMSLISAKKIKSIRKDQGLGAKLEKYFALTIVRYSVIAFGSLMLAIIFYLTLDNWMSMLFAINLIFSIVLWPSSSKVCKDLRLKGDEREMVYYQKDRF